MLPAYTENYTTINTGLQPERKDWCISPVPGKVAQVSVLQNSGKTFEYACRYPATEDSVAVIGHGLPQYDMLPDPPTTSPNTGSMGQVRATQASLTIKRAHAVEVDFVVLPVTEKADITRCLKYLKFGSADYPKTLQYDKHIALINPITYYIRRIFAAASILAHPQFAKKADLELAKQEILREKTIDSAMVSLTWAMGGGVGIDFSDIHIATDEADVFLDQIAKDLNTSDFRDARLKSMHDCGERLVSADSVQTYVNRYVHMGAVALMVRGGFKNLLEAYLQTEPPVDRVQLRKILSGIGNGETYALL